MHRRQFIGWTAAASGGAAAASVIGCGGGEAADPGPDAGAGPDADPLACEPTRSDALGPFFESGAPMRAKIAADDEPGERLALAGRIVEIDCDTPVSGVLIDVWQADRNGAYHDAAVEYRLRGQVLTDADGVFAIETIRPGHYENGPGNWRPAHIHLMFAKPGFASFATQIYFAGDPYLQPNDGCGTCGSDDPERIVELAGDAGSGWSGELRIVLGRS